MPPRRAAEPRPLAAPWKRPSEARAAEEASRASLPRHSCVVRAGEASDGSRGLPAGKRRFFTLKT